MSRIDHTDKATAADLQSLWDVVLAGLLRIAAKGNPSIELLMTARRFMADSGYQNTNASADRTQRQLRKLERLYREGLIAALGSGDVPSAGLLAEARVYRDQLLRQQAIEGTTPSAHRLPTLPDIPFH